MFGCTLRELDARMDARELGFWIAHSRTRPIDTLALFDDWFATLKYALIACHGGSENMRLADLKLLRDKPIEQVIADNQARQNQKLIAAFSAVKAAQRGN